MLLWVAERIAREAPEFPLWFAVDDARLADCVTAAGFRAIMTSGAHQSGTDRIAEANRTVGAALELNVQADEPMVTRGPVALLPLPLGLGSLQACRSPAQAVFQPCALLTGGG